MIHVQIASQLTADGVHGVRWVLLESAEPMPADAGPAASPETGTRPAAPAVEPPPVPVSAESVVDSLRLRLLKALVVALGLGAALWTAAVQIGPPGRSTLPAAPAPASPASSTPAVAAPQAAVAAPASAAPASQASGPAPAAHTPGAAQPPGGPASADLSRLTASL